jgi:hypothetical protein
VAQQRPQIAGGLRRDPGLGQQISAQQLRQRGRVDLVVLQPGRGDRLAAAGMDQMRFQLELLEQVDQPAPAVGGLEGDRVPGASAPRIGTSLAGSLGRLRLRCWAPVSSTTAIWERLRSTSIPT